jgi:flagellin-specific chaperone FliS
MNGEALYNKWLSGVQLAREELSELIDWLNGQLRLAHTRNDRTRVWEMQNQIRKVEADFSCFD